MKLNTHKCSRKGKLIKVVMSFKRATVHSDVTRGWLWIELRGTAPPQARIYRFPSVPVWVCVFVILYIIAVKPFFFDADFKSQIVAKFQKSDS